MERLARAVRMGLMLQLVAFGAYFVAVRPLLAAQSQDVLNERLQAGIEAARNRLDQLDRQNLAPRIAVLEENMVEVKWLGRAVATAVIGQFVLAGMSIGKRRQS